MVTESGIEKDEKLPEKIDKAVFPGLQGGPHEHQIAAIAVCLQEASRDSFADYGRQIVDNCKKLGEELIKRDFHLVSGGTDNHLLLVDLRSKDISGKEAQDLLERAGITLNKNAIPFDPNPPAKPSGIRLGTPTVTTRGMKEKEMERIASFISRVVSERDEKTVAEVREEIKRMCNDFPLSL